MTAVPETTCEPWVYRVSPFPPGTDAGRFWCAWIRATGDGRWKVLDGFQSSPETYLTTAGDWTMDREESTCFPDLDTAVAVATEAIRHITISNITIQEAAERFIEGRM